MLFEIDRGGKLIVGMVQDRYGRAPEAAWIVDMRSVENLYVRRVEVMGIWQKRYFECSCSVDGEVGLVDIQMGGMTSS